MAVIADGTLRWANAGHGPPWLLRRRRATRRSRPPGCRSASRRRLATRSTRRPSGPATCSSPRPTGSSKRAAAARSSASSACRRCWPSTPARWARASCVAARLPRGRGVGAAAQRRRGHPRPASAAVIRREAPSAAPSQALFAEYLELVRDAPGRRLRAHRGDLRHRGRLPRRGRRVARALRGRRRRRRAAACARSRPASPRSSACSSPPRPAAAATRARCWPSSSGSRAEDGRERVRLLHDRGPARGARPLRRVRLSAGGRRRDRRAHGPVAGEATLTPRRARRPP